MWEGAIVIRRCDSPKEVCQLVGGVMVIGRGNRD